MATSVKNNNVFEFTNKFGTTQFTMANGFVYTRERYLFNFKPAWNKGDCWFECEPNYVNHLY